MADNEQRGVIFVANFTDKSYGFVGMMAIQITSRFIGEYKVGAICSGAGNRNTLLLTDR